MHEFIIRDQQYSAVSVFERRREEDSWKNLLFIYSSFKCGSWEIL